MICFILLLVTLECLPHARNYFTFWRQRNEQSQTPSFMDFYVFLWRQGIKKETKP